MAGEHSGVLSGRTMGIIHTADVRDAATLLIWTWPLWGRMRAHHTAVRDGGKTLRVARTSEERAVTRCSRRYLAAASNTMVVGCRGLTVESTQQVGRKDRDAYGTE